MDKKPFISIDFVDFWPSLVKNDNYIYHLLNKVYTIEISKEPDILFFSCFGKKHLQYNCLKIYYCGENRRPDFTGCDYALTYDLINDKRHFRWPLYAHHIDFENAWKKIIQIKTREEAATILANKKKFCCMVVSNANCKKRNDFFHQLSAYKKVDSGGKYWNNIEAIVANKMDFIKDYKFVIAFENSSFPGYTTEKIIQPFIAQCIPIYWGNSKIAIDFNENAFIDATNQSFQDVIQQIISIDKNDDKAIEMLMEPVFRNGLIPADIDEINVIAFLQNAINTRSEIQLVSNNKFKNLLHRYRLKYFYSKRKLKRLSNF
jgi:hypothetical protein